MLQVKEICKQYKTGSLVQQALDHVSLNLRENEFVAILGPSGSGKTTLLNIIGGLDRYDSGDLVINGVSTKKYKDRDWDSYRNHTIGFVFQSYNLIPHQTVLANVELALTIGGISRAERKRRAKEALEKVGLGEQLHKKPSQMSGGQMQRVAIARALVNDPDILLADEPTGALDSDTSVQVMDLLKEVAADRLVVMVTHNPELAEKYATRIVKLKDGKIVSDSDPYIVENEEEPVHKNFGKASMSFLTALGLSFNNLKTKLTRTILVAFAGSIGITGIALILSLSNGVDQYIKSVEEETLSEYPLEISNASFDIAAFMGVQAETWRSEAEVVEMKTLSNMLTKFTSNDLTSLQKYFESGESGIEPYTRTIEYSYNLAPEIYRLEGNKYYRVNPDSTFADIGFSMSTLYASSFSSNSFMVLPEAENLYQSQYDVKAGRWPENDHEMVVVLTDSGRIADLTLYALGLKDQEELNAIVRAYAAGESYDADTSVGEYEYEDFIGLSFKLVHSCDYYQYDSTYKVWTNKIEDKRFMMDLVKAGEDLVVVGIVQPKEDATVAMLSSGVYFMPELIPDLVAYAEASAIVQAQMENPDVDIISGTPFGEETDGSFDMKDLFSVDEDALANAIQFDTSSLEMDFSGIDVSGLDYSSMDLSNLSMPEFDMGELLSKVEIHVEPTEMASLFADLTADYREAHKDDPSLDLSRLGASFSEYMATEEAREIIRTNMEAILSQEGIQAALESAMTDAVLKVVSGYAAYAEANGITDFSGLQDFLATPEGQQSLTDATIAAAQGIAAIDVDDAAVEKMQTELMDGYSAYAAAQGLPDVNAVVEDFTAWLQSESVQERIMETATSAIDTKALEEAAKEMMGEYSTQLSSALTSAMSSLMEQLASQISYAITDAMSEMAGSLENALKIDGDAFAKAFKVTMTEDEVQELMTAMMSQSVTTYDGNLTKMGYTDLGKPTSITIYPKDFESKAAIKDILNAYNERMRENGEEDKVISYSDIVGTMMSSVTDIINAISYVLVAFVAISLVVSSIMIGVITYISVLERRKEIGILRAIGASKRNISEVFNAETFIIGLLAGAIGVGMTELILIPGNILIHHLTNMDSISAIMPAAAGVVLVVLSVILTLIGGLIPSSKAAKSDPVAALRTE